MTDTTELASILNVPIITNGNFQGREGPPVVVDDFLQSQLIKGSNMFQPYLKIAREDGYMPGNPDFFQRLGKRMPALISLNHKVTEDDKIKESLLDVEVKFSQKNGWIHEDFSGIEPVVADIIRRHFPKRSVEVLELNHPETGERLPVIISTAFLDNATPPAVPGQSDDLLVEFSALDESHYIIQTDQPAKGVNIMADEKGKPVDVAELQKSQATLTKKLAELQTQVAASEKDKADALKLAEKTKTDAIEAAKNAELSAIELAAKKQDDAIRAATKADRKALAELQAKVDANDADKTIAELSRIRNVDGQPAVVLPAFLDIVRAELTGSGFVELAAGQTYRQHAAKRYEQIIELAGAGLTVPVGSDGAGHFEKPGTEKPKTDEEKISELQAADPKLDYGDAWEEIESQKLAKEGK